MNNWQRDMSRAWVEINLDAVEHNIKEIKRLLKPGVKLMGVVKADAYGHGVAETAETIVKSGADELAIAFVDEAIQLRECGFDIPLLVLGETPTERAEELVKYDIMPCVFDFDFAKKVSEEAVRQNKTVKIHIKIDTGMSRIGFLFDDNEDIRENTVEEILRIAELPSLSIEGIFTHFATADETDAEYTYLQFERFSRLMDRLENEGIHIPTKHVSNSAAIIQFPEMQLDMVRAGVIMYGMYPSEDVNRDKLKLIPAMTFKTRIVNVKDVGAGVSVSYGRTYTTETPMKIATIAVGYADGYSRILSGKVKVSFGDKKLKQIGRICMDQCMIDASGVNNINVGDEVTLFGGGENTGIPVEVVAGLMGTINYEMTCIVGKRIPRIYIKAGKVVSSLNHSLHR